MTLTPTQTGFTVTVHGTPAPQGSKTAMPVRNKTGKVVKINQVESSAGVKPWRAAVVRALRQSRAPLVPGPVAVGITYYLDRPTGHYGTGRNAGALRPSAPAYPAVTPDLDKLDRATLDALTIARVIEDDSRVVDLPTRKRYVDPGEGTRAGAVITVSPVLE